MMAATLFIIKIPNEQKTEEEVIESDKKLNDDKKEDMILQEEETRSSSITNDGPTVRFADDSDLEVDAQRVIETNNTEDDLSSLRDFSTSKNIETCSSNNHKKKHNEEVASSESEMGDVYKYKLNEDEEEQQPLNPTSSETISSTTTSQHVNDEKECPTTQTHDESVEEIENPTTGVETIEPKSPGAGVMLDFIIKEPLQTQLQSSLESMEITNISWSDVEGYKQAFFIDCGDPNRVEDILETIVSLGIGEKVAGTSVSLFPATVHIENLDANKDDESVLDLQKETESEFKKSVKSRMVVAQVVETVRSNAQFTFDYCMLITLASVIAVVGLIENSSVILVASMLISPLMGPILAGTFGITIQNRPLQNLGIRSEFIGLCMCLICGFIGGLIAGGIHLQGLTGYIDEWPTLEMKSRGMSRSLLIGVFIALPSGAAVSLSVLGGNAGSIIGVAISASLLPPAVNAGMLWAFALLTTITPLENVPLDNSSIIIKSELGCLPFLDNDYEAVYSCNMAKEMGIMGAVSLLLTLINIICIFLVGVVMLKIKEVVPQTSLSEFWGHDLKVARDSYKTMKGSESVFLNQKFQNEWEKINKSNERKDSVKRRKDVNLDRILQAISSSLPNNHYWTLPYKPEDSHDKDPTAHTIHNLHYSKWFHYETMAPSPGITVARPFSFPNYNEETPTKTPKYKKHKKIRFNSSNGRKKNKFTVTPVRESSLLKKSINETSYDM